MTPADRGQYVMCLDVHGCAVVYADVHGDLIHVYCLNTVMYSSPPRCTMIYNHEGVEYIQ
jgi:hypothetical protein